MNRKETNKNIIGSVNVKMEITETQLNDMLVNAFEGGINYWCSAAKATLVNETIPKQTHLADDIASGRVLEIEITDSESEDHEYDIPKEKAGKHIVSRDKLIEAFQIMADKYPRHMKDFLDENADADTADVWFQCAVFGESIYG